MARFNGRASDIMIITRFDSRKQFVATIACYAILYNQRIPRRALAHRTPLETTRQSQKDKSKLFARSARKLLGPTPALPADSLQTSAGLLRSTHATSERGHDAQDLCEQWVLGDDDSQ